MDKIRPFSEGISTGNDYIDPDNRSNDFSQAYPKSSFAILKKNKIPLTPEEYAIVMKREAIWHHGPHGEKTPAVWKSKDSHGNIIYVTNTHRAYQTGKTLESTINKYHKFIKGTA